jgi:hydroxymethylglutaryl-CoA lyase
VQRAINTSAVRTVGFPYSVSPTFLRNNQNQTLDEAIDEMEKIKEKADDAGLDTIVYISMAFGNPYGDPWSVQEVVEAVGIMESYGIKTISLADTVGIAGPPQVHELISAVLEKYNYLEIGIHLHSRPEKAVEKILAAYDAGCRRFDSAIGGLGGCPFAQDMLVGNISTEKMIEALAQRDAVPALKSLDTLARVSTELGARYTASQAAD